MGEQKTGSTENTSQQLKSLTTGTLHLGLQTAVRTQFQEHCEEQAASAVAAGAVIVTLRQAVIELTVRTAYVLTYSHI